MADIISEQGTLYGTKNGNSVYGTDQDDVIDAQEATDTVYAGTGADTVILGLDSGNNTLHDIDEEGVRDRIRLEEGISQDDIRLTQSGNNLILKLEQDDIVIGSHTLTNGALDTNFLFEDLEFSDGTVVALSDFAIEWHDTTSRSHGDFTGLEDHENTFYGYTGYDDFIGSTKTDTYVFNRGDEVDTITDTGGIDVIQFGEGITRDDILIARNGDAIVVAVLQDGVEMNDYITINNARIDDKAFVETLRLHDGSEYQVADIISEQGTLYGTKNGNSVYGTDQDDVIDAQEGYDTVYAGTGADTVVLGYDSGNDTLHDFDEEGVRDHIRIEAGITQDDIRLTQSGNNLVLQLEQDDVVVNSHTLINAVLDTNFLFEDLVFSDESVIALSDYAIEWHDTTSRSHGDFTGMENHENIFYGYTGYDDFIGSTKTDIYVFNRGDETDTIMDTGGDDIIQFGEGIAASDLKLITNGDDLVLQIWNEGVQSSDQMTMVDAYADENYQVENINFADGTSTTLLGLMGLSEDPLL